MFYKFHITFLLFQCDQILLLSIREFIHNRYGHLMTRHKPLIKGLSLLLKMKLQYAKLYSFKSLVRRLENLFQVTIVHIKENHNHSYRTFVPLDHLLVQKSHYAMQFFPFNLLTKFKFLHNWVNILQYLFYLKNMPLIRDIFQVLIYCLYSLQVTLNIWCNQVNLRYMPNKMVFCFGLIDVQY